MTFDPMKFYEDGQRKQKRYNSLVPAFLVAVALLVGFYGFFVAYQRSHVKPKPVAPALVLPKPVHDTEFTCPSEPNGTDEGCNTWRNQATVAQSPTVWYRCDGGGSVTDLKDCPEYKTASLAVPLDTCDDGTMVRDGFKDCKPRKHKRKTVCVAVNEYIDGAGDSDFWMIPETMIWFPTHRECNKFWANPIPLWAGAHPIVWNKSDCPRAPDGDGDYYVDSDGCLRLSFTPMPITCGADEECRWSVAHVTPDKPKPSCIGADGCNPGPNQDISKQVVKMPDCKMPADIDVCPTQTLDPKAADDKKAKP